MLTLWLILPIGIDFWLDNPDPPEKPPHRPNLPQTVLPVPTPNPMPPHNENNTPDGWELQAGSK